MTLSIASLRASYSTAKDERHALKAHERHQKAINAAHSAREELDQHDRAFRVTKARARDKRIELLRAVGDAEGKEKLAKLEVDELLGDGE